MGWNLYLLARYASSLRSLASLAGGLNLEKNKTIKELHKKLSAIKKYEWQFFLHFLQHSRTTLNRNYIFYSFLTEIQKSKQYFKYTLRDIFKCEYYISRKNSRFILFLHFKCKNNAVKLNCIFKDFHFIASSSKCTLNWKVIS